MPPRTLPVSLALIVATMIAGAAIRFAPFGLPYSVVKYGGSALWALAIYWMISTLLPRLRIASAAALAGAIATTIEFGKLYHAPAIDAFRLTLPGILILGRYFSVRDIAAYWLAIAAGAFIDCAVRPTGRIRAQTDKSRRQSIR